MAARIRVAAVAIVVVGAACGQSAASTATAHRTTASPSTTGVPREPVSLVLETDAPSKPPAVVIVVRSHAHDIAIPGTLYNEDWAPSSDVIQPPTSGPTRWPKPTTIDGGDNPVIALDTPSVPDFVLVKSYAHVVGVFLNPEPLPVAIFGCNHFTAPKCVAEETASGIQVLGVDQSIYSGTYLVIFCQWHLPSNQRGLGYRSDSVTASWLFRVVHTRATGP
jgi:hypothetical protein